MTTATTTTTTTTTTLYLHRQCRLVGHSTSTLRRRNRPPEKNYPSDVVGFLLATVNVVTVIMTSNVKFRLAVVPLLLFNVGQVFGLYSLQLHERLLFQWDLDFDRDILTAKVTYKPLPSEDGDPKGRGQSINPLGPRVPNPGCLKQFCPRDLSTSLRSKTGGIV